MLTHSGRFGGGRTQDLGGTGNESLRALDEFGEVTPESEVFPRT